MSLLYFLYILFCVVLAVQQSGAEALPVPVPVPVPGTLSDDNLAAIGSFSFNVNRFRTGLSSEEASANSAAISSKDELSISAGIGNSYKDYGYYYTYPFQDPSLPISVRVSDLLNRLTLTEKVLQLFVDSSDAHGEWTNGIQHLGVNNFSVAGQTVFRGPSNGCNINCQSGKIDGFATVFPQGIAQASTFNAQLIFELGTAAGDESAAIQRHYPNRSVEYRTAASSVINIVRDGRWGRVAETYGEDPVLTTTMAVAFNKAVMGYDTIDAKNFTNKWLKVLPVLRHFVDYDGPDKGRFSFNGVISDFDLELTFFPAWKALIEQLSSGDDSNIPSMLGVMSAIGATNGVPDVVSKRLLQDVLRYEWNFNGFVLSDCDPMSEVSATFHYTDSYEETVALSVSNGNDAECGPIFANLDNATRHGLVTEQIIDVAATRILRSRVAVGDLDPVDLDPYIGIPYSVVDSPAHRELARQVVRESVVLLKNSPAVLPLSANAMKKIAVIGPSANDSSVQAHTYHGTPFAWWTVLDGVLSIANGSGIDVEYTYGANRGDTNDSDFAHAVQICQNADAIIFVGGLDNSFEEEDTDRENFRLPGGQLQLIQLIYGKFPKAAFAVLLVSGGPVSEPWIMENIPSVLWMGYQGQAADAVADVLFGKYAPSGRLPYTIPLDSSQIPNITDYSMSAPPGRTYRFLDYMAAPPLLPFGFGLTYSDITYSKLTVTSTAGSQRLIYQNPFNVSVTITNGGPWPMDVAVLLFASFIDSPVQNIPTRQLLQFSKVSLANGADQTISFFVSLPNQPALGARRQQYPGTIRLWIGDAMYEAIAVQMPVALE